MALIPFSRNGCSLKPGKHAVLAAEQNASFRWVPYAGAVMTAREDLTTIVTIILPVENEQEAERTLASLHESAGSEGIITVSFRYRGKDYRYRFRRGEDGFVLE